MDCLHGIVPVPFFIFWKIRERSFPIIDIDTRCRVLCYTKHNYGTIDTTGKLKLQSCVFPIIELFKSRVNDYKKILCRNKKHFNYACMVT